MKHLVERERKKDIYQSACAAGPHINALYPLFLPDSRIRLKHKAKEALASECNGVF